MYSSLRFRNESVFKEIFLKRIKGYQRGNDRFRLVTFAMVARIDARLGASPAGAFSSLLMYSFIYVLVLVLISVDNCSAHTYSRHDLLGIGTHSERAVSAEYLGEHRIPEDIARIPGDSWFMVPDLKRKRRRRDRKQRRGRRGGLLARMKRCTDKPALPSIANVRSIAYKLDELRLRVATNNIVKDSCVLIFTETWLQVSIADSAVALEGRTAHRADRTKASGKHHGGGLLIFPKDSWSSCE